MRSIAGTLAHWRELVFSGLAFRFADFASMRPGQREAAGRGLRRKEANDDPGAKQ